ncbi:trichohyalin-like [Copidosoma floridanum]|uniref:trichohyalin-like n=1 Tax=Copidosoma floridanum TaxID=29053 RepID=UPI0006C9E2DF|nr:trichohyalin-like [Copidosoma floridanum]
MAGDVGAAGGSGVVGTSVPLAARPQANVVGTSSVPLGYRLGRLDCSRRPKPAKPLIGYDPKEAALHMALEDERKAQLYFYEMQQEKREQWKAIEVEIKRRVQLGMEAYEQDLEERRDQLREMLVREEAELTRELVEKSRKLEEERAAELEARAAEAAEEAEAKRLELLREKQLQRYVELNEELKESRRRAWTVDAKRVNRVQIEEAEQRRRREQEDESFWHELAERRGREEAAEMASTATRRAELERETARQLREQMREREEQRRQCSGPLEFGMLRIGEREEVDEEERREKKRRAREELDRQLGQARESLQRRRDEERALAEMAAIFAKEEPEPGEARRNKEARRREALAFMESMRVRCLLDFGPVHRNDMCPFAPNWGLMSARDRQIWSGFREAVSCREAEAEECARRLATEAEFKRREAARQHREERARTCRETKLAWDRQIEEKRQRQLLELEADRAELSTGKSVPTKQEEKARRHKAAVEYGQELLAQHEWIEARRAREQREIEETVEQQKAERQHEEARMARELELREARPVPCGAVS